VIRSSETYQRFLTDADATVAVGVELAGTIAEVVPASKGLVIYLHGDLGAGKTTFSRGFLQGCGHSGKVPSPTYTLVEPYELEPRHVYHLDLYRLQDGAELEFLGLNDLPSNALMLVEWPGQGGKDLVPPDLEIYLALQEREGDAEPQPGRSISLKARSGNGDAVLQKLAAASVA